MTLGAFVVLAALLGAFLAVSRRWLSADLALMAGLCLVTVAGVLDPREAVRGFASTAVVAVASLYVVAAALTREGLWSSLLPESVLDVLERTSSRLGVDALYESVVEHFDGDEPRESTGPLQRAAIYGGIAAIVVLPVAGVLRFESAALLAAVAIIVSGSLTPDDARRAVDWEVVVTVGAVIGYGRALAETGAVEAMVGGLQQIGALSASPIAVGVAVTSAVVLPALAPRRVAASVLPLALSAALFVVSPGAVL